MIPMKELKEAVKSQRRGPPKPRDPTQYVSCWTERDVLEGDVVDAFVMILRTQGCHWARESGCSMCGYFNDTAGQGVGERELLHQFEEAMKNFSGERIVKIFTSGSYINEDEIPKTAQDAILADLALKTEKIIFETRPEFVTKERIEDLVSPNKIEVAIGLESATDYVLEHSINKGFTVAYFEKAARLLNRMNIPIKTYLLVKPPFLSEKEAIEDAVSSARFASEYSKTISFNPVNVQRHTIVDRLWRNGEFRPPWLWSVVEVLKQSNTLDDVRVMSSPTGGGTKRGAHNCGKCDKEVLRAMEEFSLSQESFLLEELECECKRHWHDILNIEGFAHTHGDLFRLI
jgi:radical SAM enzyme (TIGR01210 family)